MQNLCFFLRKQTLSETFLVYSFSFEYVWMSNFFQVKWHLSNTTSAKVPIPCSSFAFFFFERHFFVQRIWWSHAESFPFGGEGWGRGGIPDLWSNVGLFKCKGDPFLQTLKLALNFITVAKLSMCLSGCRVRTIKCHGLYSSESAFRLLHLINVKRWNSVPIGVNGKILLDFIGTMILHKKSAPLSPRSPRWYQQREAICSLLCGLFYILSFCVFLSLIKMNPNWKHISGSLDRATAFQGFKKTSINEIHDF